MAAIRCNVCGRSESEVQAAVWARGGDDQLPWVQLRGASGLEVNVCGECAARAEAARRSAQPDGQGMPFTGRPVGRGVAGPKERPLDARQF
jgi:hypothetical protein